MMMAGAVFFAAPVAGANPVTKAIPVADLPLAVEGRQLHNTEHPKEQSPPKVLLLHGAISRSMVELVHQTLRENVGQPFPADLIVLLDSPGGDGVAAMAIGELLRRTKAHVFVTGQCASACVFILAAGVVRGADAYTVGLHRGRVTVSRADGSVKRELDVAQDANALKFLRDFENKAIDYFLRMGMSAEVFKTMQKFERRTVYRLNTEEMRRYKLVGIEPSYLAEWMKKIPLSVSLGALSAREFVRRVERTPSRCGLYEKDAQDFVECYRENLLDFY